MSKKHVLVISILVVSLIFSTLIIIKPMGEEPPTVKALQSSSYNVL